MYFYVLEIEYTMSNLSWVIEFCFLYPTHESSVYISTLALAIEI